MKYLLILCFSLSLFLKLTQQDVKVDGGSGSVDAEFKSGLKTDTENVKLKEEFEKAEKYKFEAEVNRMMKLIINSLYRNKEIFLRELISNSADALHKIRKLALTDKSALDTNENLDIRIKIDKDDNILNIMDSGVGMTKQDLITNLGTIAKSGTAEFFSKMQNETQDINDLIGKFGVGFYSAFLVADKVTVTTKHNDDDQYIWESDSSAYKIIKDPRGDTLKRGTTVSLHMKDEASDYLQSETIKNLVKKYSQFITFPIYLWDSKEIDVEEESEETDVTEKPETAEKSEDDETVVEEEKDKKEKKTVKKTVWDWVLLNENKPIWTRKPSEISDEEYQQFYKAISNSKDDFMVKVHFKAEGDISFIGLFFVPKKQQASSIQNYDTAKASIKLYVSRVFITDEFDTLPKYLSFVTGIVDSEDLSLNVSRETIQHGKLLKMLIKKITKKILEAFRKLSLEDYDNFWKEYSTNIKLGILEDSNHRNTLAKLLKFQSSQTNNLTFISDYIKRMKPDQEKIFYLAGSSLDEVRQSPFIEKLNKYKYEVLFLVEAVDEYTLNSIPEFEGKKFLNVAKEGFTLPEEKEATESMKKKFEPLTKWIEETALKNQILRATVSERLSSSPCAIVADMFGWTGNMERLAISAAHQKANDIEKNYFLNQKKILEINPSHQAIEILLDKVEEDPKDPEAKALMETLFETAKLKSGFMLRNPVDYANKIESMIFKVYDIPVDVPFNDADMDNKVSENDSVDDNIDSDSESNHEHEEL